MCAISGYFSLQTSFAIDRVLAQTRAALSRSSHRGPDNQALLTLPSGVLGHCRLSIVDLSSKANQPMSDATDCHYIILNGEIFNHAALRKQLQTEGVVFTTNSDTEVLLQLIIRKGKEALCELNGFFAFAYHNSATGYTLLVRDRMGEKPLFFYHDDTKLCFASELSALLAYDVPREADTTSLSMLLQFSYIPPQYTILRGVEKLLPGTCLEIKRDETGKSQVEYSTWYADSYTQKELIPTDIKTIREVFETKLEEAVRLRMQADVPVGCLLSGGMDSSIVAFLAARHRNNLETFSMGFADTPFLDETEYAKRVAKHLGTRHHAVQLPAGSFAKAFHEMIATLDEPFADASMVALWLLCKEVRQHVKVALSGDGADELLGGYNKHRAFLKSLAPGLLNEWLPGFSPIINVLPTSRQHPLTNLIRQAKRYNKSLQKTFKERYIYLSSWSEGTYHEELIANLNISEKGLRINHYVSDLDKQDANTLLLAEQRLVLRGDMLPKVDKASMAHGLEIRPPFLDHNVVEFINSLPVTHKFNLKEGKILLRQTFSQHLPAEVFTRKKKGFEIPLEKLLRNDLRSLVLATLNESNIRKAGLFNWTEMKEVLKDFYTYSKSTHASLVYTLLVFELWRTKHL